MVVHSTPASPWDGVLIKKVGKCLLSLWQSGEYFLCVVGQFVLTEVSKMLICVLLWLSSKKQNKWDLFMFSSLFLLLPIFKKEARPSVPPFSRCCPRKQNLLVNKLCPIRCERLSLLWSICQVLQWVGGEGSHWVEERWGREKSKLSRVSWF